MPKLSKIMKLRLQHEYEEMQKVPKTPLYDWTIAPGEEAPFARSYIVTYHIKTLVENGYKLEWQHETAVIFTKEAIDRSWEAKVVEGSVPYHPHFWSRGRVDVWDSNGPDTWLYETINFTGKLLQFQPDFINLRSPAHVDAAYYWMEHRDDMDENGNQLFPTSDAEFPVPEPKRDENGNQLFPTNNAGVPTPETKMEKTAVQVLDLTVVFPGGDRVEVEVESDTILKDVLMQLVDAEVIEPHPADNIRFVTDAEGRTLADCGVQNGDTLDVCFDSISGICWVDCTHST